ncbi:MAG TPA: nitroreductase family protein [Gammaproteobacteria bacterium]|nr:nitroreductase family protein [Gammaproteobacteria bacterium]
MPDTSEAADLTTLIRAATLAPSSHNTQPWIFQVQDQRVRLFADRTRALPANDPDDRELTISCGCALLNLRVAADAAGLNMRLRCLPYPHDSDLLAEIELLSARRDSHELAALALAIPRRRTYRKRFADRAVSDSAIGELTKVAEAEGAIFHRFALPNERAAVARLISDGDVVQWSDVNWRRELAQWMHARHQGDGLTVPDLIAPVAQAVVKNFNIGSRVAARDRRLAEASPMLAVVATASDGAVQWLRAGQALERVLLVAAHNGLQASFLNQPIQVDSLRPKLQAMIPGRPFPQILLRIGFPTGQVAAAPRRELSEVFETAMD